MCVNARYINSCRGTSSNIHTEDVDDDDDVGLRVLGCQVDNRGYTSCGVYIPCIYRHVTVGDSIQVLINSLVC